MLPARVARLLPGDARRADRDGRGRLVGRRAARRQRRLGRAAPGRRGAAHPAGARRTASAPALEQELLAALGGGGAYFAGSCGHGRRRERPRAHRRALEPRLGRAVTNDTFAPVRALLGGAARRRTARSGRRPARESYRGRGRPRPAVRSRTADRRRAGWSLLPLAEDDATVRAAATAEIAARPVRRRHPRRRAVREVPGGFAQAYRSSPASRRPAAPPRLRHREARRGAVRHRRHRRPPARVRRDANDEAQDPAVLSSRRPTRRTPTAPRSAWPARSATAGTAPAGRRARSSCSSTATWCSTSSAAASPCSRFTADDAVPRGSPPTALAATVDRAGRADSSASRGQRRVRLRHDVGSALGRPGSPRRPQRRPACAPRTEARVPEGDTVYRAAKHLTRRWPGQVLTALRLARAAVRHRRPDRRDRRRACQPRQAPAACASSGADPLPPQDGGVLARVPRAARAGGGRRSRRASCSSTAEWQAVGFDLGTSRWCARDRGGRVVGHLGPDLLGPDWDAAEALRQLERDPDAPIGAGAAGPAQPRGRRKRVRERALLPPRRAAHPSGRRGAGPARA